MGAIEYKSNLTSFTNFAAFPSDYVIPMVIPNYRKALSRCLVIPTATLARLGEEESSVCSNAAKASLVSLLNRGSRLRTLYILMYTYS